MTGGAVKAACEAVRERVLAVAGERLGLPAAAFEPDAVRDPRWRALLAFFVPPLAPYWALRSGMSARAAIWIGSVVVYTSLLGISAL